MDACCCNFAGCEKNELLAEGGSIRLVMDGDALARLRGGEMGGGALAGICGLSSMMPPRIGSYLCPELEGRGVVGGTLMWARFGLL
jgi:hypothetical protein